MKALAYCCISVILIITILFGGGSVKAQTSTFTVTNLNDSGAGSLRQAILNANSSAGPDTIIFTVAGTINVMSPLPILNDPTGGTKIDGSTAPNYAGVPVVILKGPSASGGAHGIWIGSANNEVKGLQFNTFGVAIEIMGFSPSSNIIAGNYIGTDGTIAIPNGGGVYIEGSNNQIGTNGDGIDDIAERNVISGNTAYGIYITRNSSSAPIANANVVAGNYIGTNASGTAALGNLGSASIHIMTGAENTRIGTNGDGVSDLAERNLISGNAGAGIFVLGSNTVIAGNYIGTDATGMIAIANGLSPSAPYKSGIYISGTSTTGYNNRIGTDGNGVGDEAERNVISGNKCVGVVLAQNGPSNTIIAGNYIGINSLGTGALGNGCEGGIFTNGFNTRIGTDGNGVGDEAERNVISGNIGDVTYGGGNGIYGGGSDIVIAGNYIGTDRTGAFPLGNSRSGIWLPTASNIRIGTDGNGIADDMERNIISGNGYYGVDIRSTITSFVVAGNYIGTDVSGMQGLGNGQWGLIVGSGRVGTNSDGVSDEAERNVISGNGRDGIWVTGHGGIIAGNLIGTDATGSGALGNTGSGVDVGNSSNLMIGGVTDSAVNMIGFNGGSGLKIGPYGTGNAIRRNAIFSNMALGIDLYYYGVVAPNDAGDSDTGANNLQNYPILNAVTLESGMAQIQGGLNSQANTTYALEFFANSSADDSGYGEGEYFLGSASVTTDATGNTTFTVTFPEPPATMTSFTATATDPSGNTSEFSRAFQLVTNHLPVANDDNTTVNEDAPTLINVTANDTDPDGNLTPATAVALSGPAHGSLVNHANGSFTYTPAANYHGADNFTYRVCDSGGLCDEAVVSITIKPVNDAPIADSKTVTTVEDTAMGITLTGSDIDGDALNFSAVTPPAHGTLSGTAPDLTYTADPNYNGADSFTFKANDGTADSNEATVTIAVNSVNDAPTAMDDSATADEDITINIDVLANDSDVDNDPLEVSAVSGSTHGAVSTDSSTVTYTPTANYCGTDNFTYTVSDGQGGTSTGAVSITVTCVDDAPVAADDSYTTDEDTKLTIPALGVLENDTDIEGSPLTAVLVVEPEHGSLTLDDDGSFEYTPAANFHGPDSFAYKANDGTLDSNESTVTITVTPVNDTPTADDQSVTTYEDTPVDITLTGSDIDGDTLTFSVVTPPANGTLSGTAPNLAYTPNLNFYGFDNFTFQACDVGSLCGLATVTAEVIQVNQPPAVDAGGPYSVVEGSSIEVTATGLDPENEPLTYEWDLDDDGTFETPGQTVTFSASRLDGPNTATIHVRVTDNGNLSAVAQSTVNVLNAAPMVEAITTSIAPTQVNTVISTSADFTDPGTPDAHTTIWDWGDTHTSAGVITETNGSRSVTGSHTYTFAGVYTVKVTVSDDDGDSGESIFQFVVIYDPDGGFVTGGGWINSPEGAYTADPALTGKATFGFVSKYQKGANVPTGNTEFQFKIADLNFKSTSYEWLVVSGSKAKYKGIGTTNGAGEYGFMLSAIDGAPDMFRIKIWDKATGEVIYDNQLGASDDADPVTAIGGGSIVVHKEK